MKNKLFYIFLIVPALTIFAQTSDSLSVKEEKILVVRDSLTTTEPYNPLAPSTAAFYSAVLPGLGQAYNKKYWKIPIIYAGIATGIYFYLDNDKDYDRFRDAYKRRLAGYTDDEFQGISTDRLIDAQKTAQKNKDVSIIVALAFYLVNVVDANVDAHLKQFNVNDDLSLQPNFDLNPLNAQPQYGLSLKYSLK
ncbi:hypothetical protein ATE92_1970 [Ulvibacter sp. MAR_2010_11]|uniref:DUF5683 domain-containing protein n=1 Tax=Ulvibacter sp. MAR_2010_11 TaxID=1250229 RepID=UPI000C2BC1E4|nr:DUF5683 domain-containing protein [Ulvibacter sp. MAR_2010_11]PKA83804.1 hypothetical protein ATE92_1970 [Ulvibacter sp. MAR_2010_11]